MPVHGCLDVEELAEVRQRGHEHDQRRGEDGGHDDRQRDVPDALEAVHAQTFTSLLQGGIEVLQRGGHVHVHVGEELQREHQQDALKAQLELAAKLNLPVNIHLRDATDDFFKVLDSCRGLGLRGNLHAFSGSKEVAARIRRYGDWYVGIGGVLTFKNAGIARDIADIPMEMILLETDSPYLAPTPLRGTRNESANIPLIAAKLAEIKGISLEEAAEVTTGNAKILFARIND